MTDHKRVQSSGDQPRAEVLGYGLKPLRGKIGRLRWRITEPSPRQLSLPLGLASKFQPIEKSGSATLKITDLPANLFAARIEQNVGRKSFNPEFLGQIFVLALLRWALGSFPGEIEPYQHQVLEGKIRELRLVKDFLVHFNAPRAPIRTGKIQEDIFVLLSRLL